jgi:hypothetical protein
MHTQTYCRILFWEHTKTTSSCSIDKYAIQNRLTEIVYHEESYDKFRFSLVCWTFPEHQPNCPCWTQTSCSQPHVTHTDSCAVEFGTFLLAINCDIETTVMVTSLLLCLHHALTALIFNLGTVRTVVLTSRSSHITPESTQTFTDWDTVCVPGLVCMFWGKGKLLTLSNTQR